MIPFIIGLIGSLGLVGIIGKGAMYIYKHWREILDLFRTVILPNVSKVVREFAKHFGPKGQIAATAIATLIDNYNAQVTHHLYTLENGQWYDTPTPSKIPVSELPPEAQARVHSVGKADMTNQMENELRMALY